MNSEYPLDHEAPPLSTSIKLIPEVEKFNQNQFLKQVQGRINQQIILDNRPKTPVQTNLMLNTLKNHFIFYNLSDSELENVKQNMLVCNVKQGQFIYRQGDIGTCFFIIQKGSVELLLDQKFQKVIRNPEGFGEISLLYRTERMSSARAKEPCQLWVIDRLGFREAVDEIIIKEYKEIKKILESSQLFSGLEDQYKDKIASVTIEKIYYKDQTIIKEGDPGSCFYLIKEGSASAYKGSKFIRKLEKGDCFGEQSLFYNTMRQITIRTDSLSTVLVVTRDSLNKIMGEKIYEITFKHFIRGAFQNNKILQRLNKIQVQKLLQHMKITSFRANEIIFRKGVKGFQKIAVVIQGQLKEDGTQGIVAIKGECYGQQGILEQNQLKILDDDVIMNTYGVIAQFTRGDLIQSMGLHRIKRLKSMKSFDKIEFDVDKREKIMAVKLDDLSYIENISSKQSDNFSQVLITKNSNNIYCLKCYDKRLLEKYGVSEYILNEAKIMSIISHPLIIVRGRSYQTQTRIFSLVQYLDGEDFLDVMDHIGLFSTKDAQFYTANILLILQYLAIKLIISRDLKPENFRVSKNGFLNLMNLSVCKQTEAEGRGLGKTFTIIGTPHYMAPEIILGKGYSNMVDLWALGVMVYQMLCGCLPFGDQTQNTYEIYEAIMHQQLKFPTFITDRKGMRFIFQLLSHNPDSRLNNSFENLKSHPWLHDVNYHSILNNKNDTQVPYIPSLKNENFYRKSKGQSLKEYIVNRQQDLKGNNKTKIKTNWSNFGEYII